MPSSAHSLSGRKANSYSHRPSEARGVREQDVASGKPDFPKSELERVAGVDRPAGGRVTQPSGVKGELKTVSFEARVQFARWGHFPELPSAYGYHRVGWLALSTIAASDCIGLTGTSGGTILVATRRGSIYASLDEGRSWEARGVPVFSNLASIRAYGSSLFVMTGTGDFARSDDDGATWTAVGTLSQAGMKGLTAVPDVGLYAASREGHVFFSETGENWRTHGSMQQLTLNALASNTPVVTHVPPPETTRLHARPAWPNPSPDGRVKLELQLTSDDAVSVDLLDATGRRLDTRSWGVLPGGTHTLAWRPDVSTTGLYFLRVRLRTGAEAQQRWVRGG